MIINDDQCGRTVGGRFARRARVQCEPDDYPPDCRYWRLRFAAARRELERRLGRPGYCAWAARTWPDDTQLCLLPWRTIAETAEAAIEALDGFEPRRREGG